MEDGIIGLTGRYVYILIAGAIVCVIASIDQVSAEFYRLLTSDGKESSERFVDKTLLIDEFVKTIDSADDVVSIVRPPGWGKTTNLDMMERFFALRVDGQSGVPVPETEDSVDRKLFLGGRLNGKRLKRLNIADKADSLKLRGTVPTLRFGLGDFDETDYREIVDRLRNVTVDLFRRHPYLVDAVPDDPIDTNRFRAYCRGAFRDVEELSRAVRFLTQLLSTYHDRKVLLLVDDYDFPLTNVFCRFMRTGRLRKQFEPQFNLIQRVTGERANPENTLERTVAKSEEFRRVFALFRSFYRATFAKNSALFGAMICGTFDVEFSDMFDGGFDNVVAHSFLEVDRKFADYYGFRESEIAGLVANVALVRQWHGYNFGARKNRTTAVYYYNSRNVRRIFGAKPATFDAFDGDNATDDRLINRLLTKTELQRTVYRLIEGEQIREPVARYFPFDSAVSVVQWSLSYLLFRGYLVSSVEESDDRGQLLSVPNRAVKRELVAKTLLWLRNNLRIEPDSVQTLSQSLARADVQVFERNLRMMIPHFVMSDKDYAAIVKCLTYSVELSDYFERHPVPFDGVALVSKKIAILLTYKVLEPDQPTVARQEAVRRLSDLSKFSYESAETVLKISLVFSGRHLGFHYELKTRNTTINEVNE